MQSRNRTTSRRISRVHRPGQRRGAIFITALGIIIILTGMVLVFAQEMRTEASASANRLSIAQADAVEQAAEMWVLGQMDSYPADAVTITTVPAEGVQVGAGYFWILHPDPTQDQQYAFGITDECSKLNINTADSLALQQLPGMTSDVADNIVDWASANDPAPNGAGSDYYQSLQEPYQAKAAAFETVEELFLVENVTSQLMYNQDLNHNGVIELPEQNANGSLTIESGVGTDTRGMFNYITCYSRDTTTATGGGARVNINSRSFTALQTAMQNSSIASSRITQIINTLTSNLPPRNAVPNWTLGTFYTASGMTAQEFGEIFDQLTTGGPAKSGLVNVNTAPAQVLMCLADGVLQQSDADTIVAARAGADQSNLAWFFSALSPSSKIVQLAPLITDRSYQYSADIVAVSGDGRSFRRVRIVADGSSTTTPSKIIYRKDLTSLGWPLDPAIRKAMRAGQPPPDAGNTTNLGSSVSVQM